MLETLREDFTRLPELLALGAPEQPKLLGGARGGAPRARLPTRCASERDTEVDQLGTVLDAL